MTGTKRNSRRRNQERHLVEATPATLRIPLIPKLDARALEARSLSGIRAEHWASTPTNLLAAESNRRRAVEECAALCRRGDRSRLGELLELAREFAQEPPLADALAECLRADRRGSRSRGRPKGVSPAVFQTMLGVGCVVEGLRRTGMSREEILEALAERSFEQLSFERLRRHSYDAIRHPGLQAQLFERRDQRQIIRRQGPAQSGLVFRVTGVRIMGTPALPLGAQLRGSFSRSASCVSLHLTVQ